MFKLYKSNFCCDCGEKLIKKYFWQKIFFYSYFCSKCIKKLERSFLLKNILVIFLVNIIFPIILVNIYLSNKSLNITTKIPPTPTPFIASKTLVDKFIIEEKCGAKTRKGKKCQRRVKTPGYCWQHKILDK
ncbi:MAG: hypothetical protein WAQ98_09170 [Blastocatellia bacterium]